MPSDSFKGSRLALLGFIAMDFLVRARLLSMPLERDEGEYAYMGQLILQGIPPYQEAFAFKFPGIYLFYAGIMRLFGETDVGIHLGLMLVHAFTILGLWLFANRIHFPKFQNSFVSPGLWTAAAYSIMSLGTSMLGLSANAEHFVLLPTVWGFYCLTHHRRLPLVFLAGMFLGIALSIKQQGLGFLAGGFLCLGVHTLHRDEESPSVTGTWFCFLLGIALPLVALIFWLKNTGVWDSFTFWCIDYARHYGSMWNWKDILRHFASKFGPVLLENLPFFGLILLPLFGGWRERSSWRGGDGILMAAGFLCTLPGGIFRPHYFIFILPGLALLSARGMMRWPVKFSWVAPLLLVWPLAWQAFLFFQAPPETASRLLYPRNTFVELRQLSVEITRQTGPGDRIAVLGSEPQVYFYSHRKSASGHLYMYPLMEPQPYAGAMQRQLIETLERTPPSLLLYVDVPNSWLKHPKADRTLPDWIPGFIEKNYSQTRSMTLPPGPGQTGDRVLTIYLKK